MDQNLVSKPDPDLTAKQGNGHSCFGIIAKTHANGLVEILVMTSSDWSDSRQIFMPERLVVPGGSGLTGETPDATLAREVSSEVAKDERPIVIRRKFEIHKVIKLGDANKGGGQHTQIFWLLDVSAETIYREIEPKVEADKTRLGKPHFMDAGEFIRDQRTKKTHREAVMILLRRLALPEAGASIRSFYAALLSKKP